MEKDAVELPVYAKMTLVIVGIIALFYVLYVGQDILVPLILAALLAMLLNPVVNFLSNRKINRTLAIFLAILAAALLVAVLLYFIGSQLSRFGDSLPIFKQKSAELYKQLLQWVAETFNIPPDKVSGWITKTQKEIMSQGTSAMSQTLGTLSGMLGLFLLLPVYIFLFLYYKTLLLTFIAQLFENAPSKMVNEVLAETKSLVQSYLVGLLTEAGIVAVLNSAGLLIIGVEYAIVLGIIGALLNIIPYIGGLIATALPMLVAITTQSPSAALWVLVLYLVVQFVDNNLIVPKIVGSKVKVNALVSIVVVLIGGALWGVSGMFLSIPLVGILKVVFDRIDPLKPFGYLIGDDQPTVAKSLTRRTKKPAMAK
ncbi:AI-2E family transporter [Runella sp.]|uniref:AI-2E family transporter n=1 Tax=Runella sp. TaxID=1960881 RepID=UPI003D0E515E